MTYTNLFILLPFFLLILFFSIKETKGIGSASDRRIVCYTQILLFLGILIRTIYLEYPFGVHLDEAINGYESWCLAHYGVDQHLNSYPVYFKSWGSGQSSLYAYLSIPFVKLFGLNTSSYRLVMALVSSFALFISYYTLRKVSKDGFFTFIALLMLAFNPWHIMKSRWALDCNLSPDMILIAVCLFICGYYVLSSQKRTLYYLLGSLFFVLAAYSYGINWFMLPTFILLLFLYFFKKKRITILQMILSFFTMLVLLFPLLLFAFNLASKGEAYQMGMMTIPQLDSSRHEATTIFGSTEPFGMFRHYMKRAAILLIWGQDNLNWNSFPFWGQFFNLFGLPFIIVAFVQMFKKRKICVVDAIFFVWLVSMIPVLLFVEPNVNHWNALWFPLLYFCARGIHFVISTTTLLRKIGITVICILSFLFCVKYFTIYTNREFRQLNNDGIAEVMNFVNSLDVDLVYNPGFSGSVTLFYAPVSPYEYNRTVVKSDRVFENVKAYGKNRFALPEKILPLSRTAYIVPNAMIKHYGLEESKFEFRRIEEYSVFWNN